MATITINSGDQITKDPSAIKSYVVDWDAANLAAGVSITSSAWYVSALRPSFTDAGLTTAQPAVLTAAQATAAIGRTIAVDSRATRIQLSGGTLHQVYDVTNQIVTTETPAQTKQKSFRVLVEQE